MKEKLFLNNLLILGIVLLTFGACFPTEAKEESFNQPQVIYGDDNRLDYYQVSDPVLQQLSESTVVLVYQTQLTSNGTGYNLSVGTTFQMDNNVCPEEPFASQPVPGFCSGFLVAPDIVVTAGHCVNGSNLGSIAFVFGFRMNSSTAVVSSFSFDDVYFGKQIIGSSTGDSDWCVIRLTRSVVNRTPLGFRKSGRIADGQSLFVIGYPVGLPVKIAGGAWVRDNSPLPYFIANLDTYGGNSGSAVFNSDTLEVEGILVRGETDFVYNSAGRCYLSNRCTDTGCSGEDVTRSTQWASLVASEAPTPTPSFSPTPTNTPLVTSTPTPTASPTSTPPPDDHGNNPQTATLLTINKLTYGEIYPAGDIDYFRFNAAKDVPYVMETMVGKIGDTVLELIDVNGTTPLIIVDDYPSSEGGSTASVIRWTCPQEGVYFLKVRSFNSTRFGNYVVRVQDQTNPFPPPDSSGFLPSDFNKDGKIDHLDILHLVSDYGIIYPTPTP